MTNGRAVETQGLDPMGALREEQEGGAFDRALDHADDHARDRAMTADIVDGAVDRYIADRRARVPDFIDRHFSFDGSLRLHRRALGWDLLRAPANLALAVPHLALKLTGAGAHALGWKRSAAWMSERQMFFTSTVAREVEWRILVELLELPCHQDRRWFRRDALAEEIWRDPRVDDVLRRVLPAIGRHADDPKFRHWLTGAMATYSGTRVAAGDLANALIAAGVGALAMKQLTPGMITLGPVVAHAAAQSMAVASFPLGTGAGAMWYGAMPVSATAVATVGVTAGMMATAAGLAAFSGIVTDPIQRALGLHRRRLNRLLDSLERELKGQDPSRFVVRDHYVARLVDLLDILGAAYRVAR